MDGSLKEVERCRDRLRYEIGRFHGEMRGEILEVKEPPVNAVVEVEISPGWVIYLTGDIELVEVIT